MTWEQGRAAIEDMIRRGRLERVPVSRGQADQLIGQAGQHIVSADEVERDLPKAQEIIDAAVKVLDQMTPF